MRRFVLRRHEDESGVSGTGDVAEGVVFADGTAVMRWNTETTSTAVYRSMEDLNAIHGHHGKTAIIFIDDDLLDSAFYAGSQVSVMPRVGGQG